MKSLFILLNITIISSVVNATEYRYTCSTDKWSIIAYTEGDKPVFHQGIANLQITDATDEQNQRVLSVKGSVWAQHGDTRGAINKETASLKANFSADGIKQSYDDEPFPIKGYANFDLNATSSTAIGKLYVPSQLNTHFKSYYSLYFDKNLKGDMLLLCSQEGAPGMTLAERLELRSNDSSFRILHDRARAIENMSSQSSRVFEAVNILANLAAKVALDTKNAEEDQPPLHQRELMLEQSAMNNLLDDLIFVHYDKKSLKEVLENNHDKQFSINEELCHIGSEKFTYFPKFKCDEAALDSQKKQKYGYNMMIRAVITQRVLLSLAKPKALNY